MVPQFVSTLLASGASVVPTGLLGQVDVPTTAPALAAGSAIQPVVILLLCVVAGIGTILLLPGTREASFRRIGGVLLGAIALIFVGLLIRWANHANSGGMGVYFWAFAAIALFGAVRVVTHPRPVYAALYFVLTVFATGGLFILLWAEFMAAALVLIYAGAILVTYVFVIMLAASSTSTRAADVMAEYDTISREPIAASAVGFAMMGVLLFVIFDKASQLEKAGAEVLPAAADIRVEGQTQELGVYLFQNQIVNVQLSGLMLTLGMVGAILIARRRVVTNQPIDRVQDVLSTPATPADDNPHSIPVYGTDNPRAKAFPET